MAAGWNRSELRLHQRKTCRLASRAFRSVLSQKQTKYAQVVEWLDCQTKETAPKGRREAQRLIQAVDCGNVVFHKYRY